MAGFQHKKKKKKKKKKNPEEKKKSRLWLRSGLQTICSFFKVCEEMLKTLILMKLLSLVTTVTA